MGEVVRVESQFLSRDAMLAWYMLWACFHLSQVSVLPKRLSLGSNKRHHPDIPGTLVFRRQKSLRNSIGVNPCGAPNAGGVG